MRTTKACHYCIKEIDSSAVKCPYCQSYQSKVKNPQLWSTIIILLCIPLFMWSTGFWSAKTYTGNEKNFEIKEVNQTVDEFKQLTFVYSIENKSNSKWNNITYEIVALDDKNKVIFSQVGSNMSWLVLPHQSTYLSVTLTNPPNAEKWAFRILDLRSNTLF